MFAYFDKLSAILLGAILLTGCASGEKLSTLPQAQLAVQSGKARIAVYRTGIYGTAVQPTVKVDGR